MITAWDVYWITRLNGLGFLCGAAVFISVAFITVWVFIMVPFELWEDNEEKHPRYLRMLYFAIGVGLSSLVILSFIPSTKEAVAIYMIPKIVNNEQVQKLPDNAMKFLNEKFEGWLNDMAGKKKDK